MCIRPKCVDAQSSPPYSESVANLRFRSHVESKHTFYYYSSWAYCLRGRTPVYVFLSGPIGVLLETLTYKRTEWRCLTLVHKVFFYNEPIPRYPYGSATARRRRVFDHYRSYDFDHRNIEGTDCKRLRIHGKVSGRPPRVWQ